MKDLLILAIFPAAMTLTAVTDLFTLTLSNRIVIALAVLFFVAAPFAGAGHARLEGLARPNEGMA